MAKRFRIPLEPEDYPNLQPTGITARTKRMVIIPMSSTDQAGLQAIYSSGDYYAAWPATYDHFRVAKTRVMDRELSVLPGGSFTATITET